MDDLIHRNEHEEFAKRIDAEHKRLNHRIGELERAMQQYSSLTIAVNKLASNMEAMLQEQSRQNKKLEELESRDGKMWRKVIEYIVVAIIGIVVGYIAKQLGM